MMCGIHGFIGAALGSFLKDKKTAFLAGVVSHFIGDLLPHHDLSPGIEAVIAVGALGSIATTQGIHSTEFWGAVGAMLPDVENGLYYLRGEKGTMLYPTHRGLHGADTNELLSQVGITLVCIGVMLVSHKDQQACEATAPSVDSQVS